MVLNIFPVHVLIYKRQFYSDIISLFYMKYKKKQKFNNEKYLMEDNKMLNKVIDQPECNNSMDKCLVMDNSRLVVLARKDSMNKNVEKK